MHRKNVLRMPSCVLLHKPYYTLTLKVSSVIQNKKYVERLYLGTPHFFMLMMMMIIMMKKMMMIIMMMKMTMMKLMMR